MKQKVLKLVALLAIMLAATWPVRGQSSSLTIGGGGGSQYHADGSTLPINLNNQHSYMRNQYIIPGSHLTAMNGAFITALKYYTTADYSHTTTSTVDVYLCEVNDTAFFEDDNKYFFAPKSNSTIVYSGTLTVSGGEMTVTFDNPFLYNGGNLMIAMENVTLGSDANISFAYQESFISGSGAASLIGDPFETLNINNAGQSVPKTTIYYSQPTTLTIATANPAMGRVKMAMQQECVFFDSYRALSQDGQDGLKSTIWYDPGAVVVDNTWYRTSSNREGITIHSWYNPDGLTVVHHVTIHMADGQRFDVMNDGHNSSVILYLANGKVYSDYDLTNMVAEGGITQIDAYGSKMVLPAGVVEGSSSNVFSVAPGSEVPVVALPRTHNYLVNWSNNATTDTAVITVNSPMTLTANFAPSPLLTITPNNNQMGSVKVATHTGKGTIHTFKATDYAGMGQSIGTVNGIYYNFPGIPEGATEWTYSDGGGGTFQIYVQKNDNEKNRPTVIFYGPNGNYYEIISDGSSSNNDSRVFLKDGNTYLDNWCNQLLWEGGVTEIEIIGDGDVLPSGVAMIDDSTFSVAPGTELTAIATAKPRYHLANWSNNSTDAQLNITMPSSPLTLTANFTANPTLTISNSADGNGNVHLDFVPTPQNLTVNDGNAKISEVPLYLLFTDNSSTRSQHIIPANQLALIDGCTLNSITFYNNNTNEWTFDGQLRVYLKEVDYTTLSSYIDYTTATTVYTGNLHRDNNGLISFTFSQPFTYHGQNLLVGVDVVEASNFNSGEFYGVSAPAGSSAGGFSDFGACAFLPKSTFNYTPILPNGVLANTDGTYNVAPGTQVNLKAVANEGYMLGSWSNNATVNDDATQTLTMGNNDLTISATFVSRPYKIDSIPLNWNVLVDDQPVTLTPYTNGNTTHGHVSIVAGSQVELVPPTEERRSIKSVSLLEAVEPLLELDLAGVTFYYAAGDTWLEAIARPENSSTGIHTVSVPGVNVIVIKNSEEKSLESSCGGQTITFQNDDFTVEETLQTYNIGNGCNFRWEVPAISY